MSESVDIKEEVEEIKDEIKEEVEEIKAEIKEEVEEIKDEIKDQNAPAPGVELSILVGQMSAKIEVLENEVKILAAKISDLEYFRDNYNGSFDNVFDRLSDLEAKNIRENNKAEEIEPAETVQEIADGLIEVEIPADTAPKEEPKPKKRHWI